MNPVKQMKLAYWSVAIFATVNAVIFVMSLFVEQEGVPDITRYLHYNLVLAVGYVLVFIVGRYSLSLVGLSIAIFLFVVGLVASEMPKNMPASYTASWVWLKWVLIAPILTTFITLLIRRSDSESGSGKN